MSESREMARGSPVTASRSPPTPRPPPLFFSCPLQAFTINLIKTSQPKESINLDQKQPCVAGDIKSRAKRIVWVFLSEFLSPNVESSSKRLKRRAFAAFRALCAVTLGYRLASLFSNHHFSFAAACHCLLVVLRNCTKAKQSAVKERKKQRGRPFLRLTVQSSFEWKTTQLSPSGRARPL